MSSSSSSSAAEHFLLCALLFLAMLSLSHYITHTEEKKLDMAHEQQQKKKLDMIKIKLNGIYQTD